MHALKGRKYYACTEERSQKRREIMVTITRRDLCRLALLSLMVAFDGRSYSPVCPCCLPLLWRIGVFFFFFFTARYSSLPPAFWSVLCPPHVPSLSSRCPHPFRGWVEE